ncbi:MAG TPA: hypothetical protein VFG11_04760 [Acidobacteriota bacterium]|nr:hypothetical protein [Acidobacteriota bacterium]
MGLDVTLMPLSKLLQAEKRAAEHNAFIKQTGFTLPKGSDQDFGYTEQIGPYAVFHHLWRYAAHLEIDGKPPLEPGTHPLDDPMYQKAIAKPETRFDQLLRHGDDDGYYYPIDFPKILNIAPEAASSGLFKKMFGGGQKTEARPVTFGSAVQLHKELLAINEFLKVPIRDESPSETYADGIHGDDWGDEKWTWCVLYFMAKKAIEHGQIMVFE